MDNIQVTFLHLIGLFSCHVTLESSLSDHVISLSHHVTLIAVNPGSKTHVTSCLGACFWSTRLCSLLLLIISLSSSKTSENNNTQLNRQKSELKTYAILPTGFGIRYYRIMINCRLVNILLLCPTLYRA